MTLYQAQIAIGFLRQRGFMAGVGEAMSASADPEGYTVLLHKPGAPPDILDCRPARFSVELIEQTMAEYAIEHDIR